MLTFEIDPWKCYNRSKLKLLMTNQDLPKNTNVMIVVILIT